MRRVDLTPPPPPGEKKRTGHDSVSVSPRRRDAGAPSVIAAARCHRDMRSCAAAACQRDGGDDSEGVKATLWAPEHIHTSTACSRRQGEEAAEAKRMGRRRDRTNLWVGVAPVERLGVAHALETTWPKVELCPPGRPGPLTPQDLLHRGRVVQRERQPPRRGGLLAAREARLSGIRCARPHARRRVRGHLV